MIGGRERDAAHDLGLIDGGVANVLDLSSMPTKFAGSNSVGLAGSSTACKMAKISFSSSSPATLRRMLRISCPRRVRRNLSA